MNEIEKIADRLEAWWSNPSSFEESRAEFRTLLRDLRGVKCDDMFTIDEIIGWAARGDPIRAAYMNDPLHGIKAWRDRHAALAEKITKEKGT